METLDSREFRRILGHYPTGVCAVTALSPAGPVGMVVGSFTSVLLDPAPVAFLPDRKSNTWLRIQAAGHFCVNILAENQLNICETLVSKADNRFHTVPYRLSGSGLPLIEDVVAWIDASCTRCTRRGTTTSRSDGCWRWMSNVLNLRSSFLRGSYGSILPFSADVREASLAA